MVLRTHCAPRRDMASIMTRIERSKGCRSVCCRASPAMGYREAIPHDGGMRRNLAEVSTLTYVLGGELVSAPSAHAPSQRRRRKGERPYEPTTFSKCSPVSDPGTCRPSDRRVSHQLCRAGKSF